MSLVTHGGGSSDDAGTTDGPATTSTATAAAEPDTSADVPLSLVATMFITLVVGTALTLCARLSAGAAIAAIAVTQAILVGAWVYGTVMPGRKGAIVLAVLASAAADVAVWHWPHGRLGVLLAVLGLAVPAMFIHQLTRGAIRVQVVSSLSATAVLLLAEVSLASLLQLRHEFGAAGGEVVSAVAAVIAAALVVGCLVDMVLPAPRFDAAVPRGLLALIASAGLGSSVGYLMLRTVDGFSTGRAVFVGAALGAVAGLLAVACAFVLHTTPVPKSALGRGLRPAIGALLPIAVLAPAAFLLCLAIRS